MTKTVSKIIFSLHMIGVSPQGGHTIKYRIPTHSTGPLVSFTGKPVVIKQARFTQILYTRVTLAAYDLLLGPRREVKQLVLWLSTCLVTRRRAHTYIDTHTSTVSATLRQANPYFFLFMASMSWRHFLFCY